MHWHGTWLKSFLVSLVGRIHLMTAIRLYGIFSEKRHEDCLGCIKLSLGVKEALANLPSLRQAVQIASQKPEGIFLNIGTLEDAFLPDGAVPDLNLRALGQAASFYSCNFTQVPSNYEVVVCPMVEPKRSPDGSFELIAGEIWARSR